MKTAIIILGAGIAILAAAWVLASNLPPAAAELVFPIVGPIVIIGGGLTTVLLKNSRAKRDLRK
jgi:ribulose 1,5-bisphosphate synthetase/thiazole synthase